MCWAMRCRPHSHHQPFPDLTYAKRSEGGNEMKPYLWPVVLALCLANWAVWADTRLEGAQIEALVSGHTLGLISGNLDEASGYFAYDGTLTGRYGSREFVGMWRTRDDRLCVGLPFFDHEICRRVFVRGNAILLYTETGSPAGRVNIRRGKPNHF